MYVWNYFQQSEEYVDTVLLIRPDYMGLPEEYAMKSKEKFGPCRIGDTTSYRLFLHNLQKATETMKGISLVRLG